MLPEPLEATFDEGTITVTFDRPLQLGVIDETPFSATPGSIASAQVTGPTTLEIQMTFGTPTELTYAPPPNSLISADGLLVPGFGPLPIS